MLRHRVGLRRRMHLFGVGQRGRQFVDGIHGLARGCVRCQQGFGRHTLLHGRGNHHNGQRFLHRFGLRRRTITLNNSNFRSSRGSGLQSHRIDATKPRVGSAFKAAARGRRDSMFRTGVGKYSVGQQRNGTIFARHDRTSRSRGWRRGNIGQSRLLHRQGLAFFNDFRRRGRRHYGRHRTLGCGGVHHRPLSTAESARGNGHYTHYGRRRSAAHRVDGERSIGFARTRCVLCCGKSALTAGGGGVLQQGAGISIVAIAVGAETFIQRARQFLNAFLRVQETFLFGIRDETHFR